MTTGDGNFYSQGNIVRDSSLSDMRFLKSGEPFLIFRSDGEIWISPDLKPDEAATKFLEALKSQFRALMKRSMT